MRQTDLTGKKFGVLIALSKIRIDGRVKWLCQCICGTRKNVREDSLVAGRSKSCGCLSRQLKKVRKEKQNSLINKRFSHLLVLWRAKKGSNHKRWMLWDCQCDCGKVITVAGSYLRAGKTTSCGCFNSSLSGLNLLLITYKTGAIKRQLEWGLTDEQFREMVCAACHYCGALPKQLGGFTGDMVTYNGLDRLDSARGYVIGNIITCCGIHNSMKGTMSYENFVTECKKVATHISNIRGK